MSTDTRITLKKPLPVPPRSTSPEIEPAEPIKLTKVAIWLSAWYMFSLTTLFLNKIILSAPDGDEYVLGITQMISTAMYGGLKIYGPSLVLGSRPRQQPEEHSGIGGGAEFYKNMTLVGIMRGTTVILGLVSLSHVAVSFTETIKASAPLFTVVFAYMILGERTPWQVTLTLLPVMGGLIICSATELSFDTIGFFAAIFNNIIDCVQNVFSKKLLTSGMTPTGLQFYTSIAAAVIQMPILIYKLIPHLLDTTATPMTNRMLWMLFFDGISYHMQSVTAYYTMSLLSPVSQSVANTVKRAALIVLSIVYFSNAVTIYNMLGVTIVVSGVFAYNYTKRTFTT